jgi:FG-GAP-like repeat
VARPRNRLFVGVGGHVVAVDPATGTAMEETDGGRRPAGWPVLCLLLQLGAAGAAAQTDSQVVAMLFPQRLVEESEQDSQAGGPPPFRTFRYAVADLDNDGSRFIVAAYSNGFSGVVRVLRRVDGNARVVDEPDLPLLGGIFPDLQLLDFDGDGRPEVAVSYSSARGPPADWVFRWDGTRLRLFGPTTIDESGDVDTPLSNADYTDIDGDGLLEILNPIEADSGDRVWQVYRLEGSAFTSGPPLYYLGDFYFPVTMPALAADSFRVPSPGPGFELTVVNGERDGGNRVHGGTIQLNGRPVVTPNDLGEGVRAVVRRVSVLARNRIAVTLVGPSGSHVLVAVGQPGR